MSNAAAHKETEELSFLCLFVSWLFAGHLSLLLFDHFLDHISADRSGLSGSKVTVISVS